MRIFYTNFGVNRTFNNHAWGFSHYHRYIRHISLPVTVLVRQVLQSPYDFDKAKLIVREMTDLLVLDLVDKGLVTDQMVLTIGYDIENLTNPERAKLYKGEITIDRYGRRIPKQAHGTVNLDRQTSSTRLIIDAVMDLYDRIVDKNLLVRRITIGANSCR